VPLLPNFTAWCATHADRQYAPLRSERNYCTVTPSTSSPHRTDNNVRYLAIILTPSDPALSGGLRNSTELPELCLGLLQSSRRIPVVFSRRSGLLRALCCSPDEDPASPSVERCIPPLLISATRTKNYKQMGLWIGCRWAVYGLWMGCRLTVDGLWMGCGLAVDGL
jgi:hypothetical protein